MIGLSFTFSWIRANAHGKSRTCAAWSNENSAVILGTFTLDGPQTCSGLRVQRYNAAALAAELGSGFALIDNLLEQHRTPTGAAQSFSYAAFRRLGP